MEKIFVAGHNGMVGSAICKKLEKNKEYQLIIASRSEVDLRDKKAVYTFIEKSKPDILIIAAARVGGIMSNMASPFDYLTDNLEIEINLIKAAFELGITKTLFLASSCIYPKISEQPIKEEYLLTGRLEPTNEGYAIAKIAGIKMLEYLYKQHNFKGLSLIPCNLYGPNDSFDAKNSHVLSALVRKFSDAQSNNTDYVEVWGTGNAKREFLHVNDLANAVALILEKAEFIGDYINVGSNSDISIKNLAEKISELTNYKGEIIFDKEKPDGMMQKLIDSSKINKLGFKPKITLEEGIIEMINIYKSK